MKRDRHYAKFQTKWIRHPAMIESHRGTDTIGIRLHGERMAGEPWSEPAMIFLDPHEAQGFAAWLSEQAEHLLAKQRRAAERKAARLAAKEART